MSLSVEARTNRPIVFITSVYRGHERDNWIDGLKTECQESEVPSGGSGCAECLTISYASDLAPEDHGSPSPADDHPLVRSGSCVRDVTPTYSKLRDPCFGNGDTLATDVLAQTTMKLDAASNSRNYSKPV